MRGWRRSVRFSWPRCDVRPASGGVAGARVLAERARINVTRNLKRAIDQIQLRPLGPRALGRARSGPGRSAATNRQLVAGELAARAAADHAAGLSTGRSGRPGPARAQGPGRLPGEPDPRSGREPGERRNRSWWTGAEVFGAVDDYDLVATQQKPPVSLLQPLLPQARDVGVHVVIARRSGGGYPALYEPVIQSMRDLAMPGLMLLRQPRRGAADRQRAAVTVPARPRSADDPRPRPRGRPAGLDRPGPLST